MANPRFPSVDENGEFESPEVRQRIKDHVVEEVKSRIDSFVGVPIFETLAEAEAWEAEHPGKRALTV